MSALILFELKMRYWRLTRTWAWQFSHRDDKAVVTIDKPGLFTVDINGQMDDQDTGKLPDSVGGGEYSGPPIHTLTIFANPFTSKVLFWKLVTSLPQTVSHLQMILEWEQFLLKNQPQQMEIGQLYSSYLVYMMLEYPSLYNQTGVIIYQVQVVSYILYHHQEYWLLNVQCAPILVSKCSKYSLELSILTQPKGLDVWKSNSSSRCRQNSV